AYLKWANLDLEQKNPAAALPKYRMALKLNPKMKQVWYSMGACHYELKSPLDSARFYLGKALEMDPNMEQARKLLEIMGIEEQIRGSRR
ncbi:MAG: tetratricopeptide repeat protein, partial [candidate division Zixibacteria bacterium]|nr:tetratricopeptide repeat protein [candidate division Zixibacteria bacterium]